MTSKQCNINRSNFAGRTLKVLLATVVALMTAWNVNADDATLSNGKVKITFAQGNKFDITSMILNGHKVIDNAGLNTEPWALTYVGPQGENPELLPSHAVYEGCKSIQSGDTSKLQFTWLLTLSYSISVNVKMTVSLPKDSELAYWDIEAGTPQGWIIRETQFPRITVNRPTDGKLITSAGWGNEYELKEKTFESNYPSWSGSMQLMLLHNTEGAFYYSTQDRNACGKRFEAIVEGEKVTLLTDVINSEAWSNHNSMTYELPWTTATGFSTEGWKAAATQWYRPFTFTTQWGNKTLESRNIPKWLYDTDLWIRAKHVNDATHEAVNKAIDYFGKGIGVHWYFWHHYPYDTHYPDYFPAKEHFTEWIADVQNKGCHVVPYINGRLWDPDADSYKAMNGASASCRKADGTLYTEIYPTSKVLNTVTCPASKIWQGIITNLVDKIQSELKTNGVYIDQIAAAAPQPCWAKNHGHATGGGDYWHYAYRNLMENLRASHLMRNNIFISEENSECYLDLFDMLLTVNTPRDGRIVPLFPIVYSGRLITAAYTYTPTDALTKGDFRFENMQCFLYGSQLGWVDPTLLMKDEAKAEAAFLKELMTMRKAQHDVFYGGRYINDYIPDGDNPTVDVVGFKGKQNVVQGSEWLSTKGKRVLYLVNMDNADHTVTLPDGKQMTIKSCKAVSINL
jgi:hypothetical protein